MKRIGILASYNGSGFLKIQKAIKENILDAQIIVVVSNNSTSNALKSAEDLNIPNFIINDKKQRN